MKKFSPSETEEGIHMEKVTVKIAGRDYSLKTDDSPEKIVKLAEQLEKNISYVARNTRNMNEVEITTMASLILLGEIESIIRGDVNSAEEMQKQLDDCNASLKKTQIELEQTQQKLEEQRKLTQSADEKAAAAAQPLKDEIESLKQQLKAAKEETTAVSNAKQAENQRHITQLAEYEKKLKSLNEEHQLETEILKEDFAKTAAEKDKAVEEKEKDNEKMRSTLSNYESSFDLYVKKKEEELTKAQEEIEALKDKLAQFEGQTGGKNGVQMTIC